MTGMNSVKSVFDRFKGGIKQPNLQWARGTHLEEEILHILQDHINLNDTHGCSKHKEKEPELEQNTGPSVNNLFNSPTAPNGGYMPNQNSNRLPVKFKFLII